MKAKKKAPKKEPVPKVMQKPDVLNDYRWRRNASIIASQLAVTFPWHETPEGDHYWRTVCEKLERLSGIRA